MDTMGITLSLNRPLKPSDSRLLPHTYVSNLVKCKMKANSEIKHCHIAFNKT